MDYKKLIRELRAEAGAIRAGKRDAWAVGCEKAATAIETLLAEREEWYGKWKTADEKPTRIDDYLCRVIIPAQGGVGMREYKVLRFDMLGKRWNCEGMIVTHWMPLPAPPEQNGKEG